jgi:hypothetical protein
MLYCADGLCSGVSAFKLEQNINNSLPFPPLVLSPASLNNGCVQRIHFTSGASVSFLLYVFTTRRPQETEILRHPSCDLHQASQPRIWESSPSVTLSSITEYISWQKNSVWRPWIRRDLSMFVTVFCCCISVWTNSAVAMAGVVPWLKELVAGLWPSRLEFDARTFYVASVVEDAHWDTFFSRQFDSLPVPRKNSSICHRRYVTLTLAGVVK